MTDRWDLFVKYAEKHQDEKAAIREYAELREFHMQIWNIFFAAYYDSLAEQTLQKYNMRQIRVMKRLHLV